jgi:NAD(P)-dependent dehydrogenase (short-subunit alcohol dehydrogenase family)
MSRFKGKVVLVTGGTSGIGKTTAIEFAKEGAKVVVAGRRPDAGQAVVNDIKAAGGQGAFFKTDVAKEADVKALVDFTVKTFGKLDIAFNNAGLEITGNAVDFKEEDYNKIFDINVKGVGFSMKYEIPEMLKAGGGAIINTSSVGGRIGMAGVGIYVASKHAVDGLTKCAALEVGKLGVRVNAVAPAVIETDMYERFVGGNADAKKYMTSLHPIGRVGQTIDVAGAVLWLASNESAFVIGQIVPVDGGLTVP